MKILIIQGAGYMARGTKLPNNKRESRLFANCTHEEYSIITDYAQYRGFSISALLRIAVLDYIRRDEHGRD